MIVQSAPITIKQRNQPNRECLYAWYPEVVPDSMTSTPTVPRDIYIHKGVDKDLIQQNSQIHGSINTGNNNNILQRYKQSIAPSERIYHSTESLDEALRTPWALHYEIQRRPATPNLPSDSNDIPIREEIPRRLKSAPLVRSLPPTSILTIPEPRFVTSIIPVPTNQVSEISTTTKPRVRASSAKARLNTTFPISNEQINDDYNQQRREIQSAQGIRQKDETKLSDEDNQQAIIQVYNDSIQQQEPSPIPPTPPPPPPPSGYVYQRSATWCPTDPPSTPLERKSFRRTIGVNPVPLNPYYVHRPGVISVKNIDKKPVIRESSASRKSPKHHRRSHHRREIRNEPLLALTPISHSTKVPLEMDGIKLIYDPTLTFDDPSLNLTKYFIEGRLYLIKDQRYNVLENIDPTFIEKYNQTSTLPQRPKYYQTIPVEKFQLPKPPMDIHYNASDTYFYNTLPKRVHRYVIDPHFISENLNVNKISLSKRPSTASVHSTINDFNRKQATPTTVYA